MSPDTEPRPKPRRRLGRLLPRNETVRRRIVRPVIHPIETLGVAAHRRSANRSEAGRLEQSATASGNLLAICQEKTGSKAYFESNPDVRMAYADFSVGSTQATRVILANPNHTISDTDPNYDRPKLLISIFNANGSRFHYQIASDLTLRNCFDQKRVGANSVNSFSMLIQSCEAVELQPFNPVINPVKPPLPQGAPGGDGGAFAG
jgi:hypothetical protein